jgi:hypothetical protein
LKEKVRVASGQGFWGDLQTAPLDQVTKGPIDYIVMDFLAEVTMSILQKQKKRNPELGYAKDLLSITEQILTFCVEKGIKIITNGGGANPKACCEAIRNIARKKRIGGVKIGIVQGDDILDRLGKFRARGITFDNLDTGESFSDVERKISSANVYFGAAPIVDALRQGADIVITGRTTDTGLTLAPMIYEFGWKEDDWDNLASGTIAGHILECGAQATGGNFSADWRAVPDLAHIGFPIAEAYPTGEIVITKHDQTGGMVTMQTVKEQLVYEIGDPARYITPDVIADFTTITLRQEAKDRVRMSGVRGKPSTDTYKVSMAYQDGYTAAGTLTFSWPDALEKARCADEVLRTRLADAGMRFEAIETEFLGLNSCHGPLAEVPDVVNEVVMRIGVRSHSHAEVERFGKEIAPLILTGPPGVTGFAGGRPKPSEVVSYWPALIPKNAVSPTVSVKKV